MRWDGYGGRETLRAGEVPGQDCIILLPEKRLLFTVIFDYNSFLFYAALHYTLPPPSFLTSFTTFLHPYLSLFSTSIILKKKSCLQAQ